MIISPFLFVAYRPARNLFLKVIMLLKHAVLVSNILFGQELSKGLMEIKIRNNINQYLVCVFNGNCLMVVDIFIYKKLIIFMILSF